MWTSAYGGVLLIKLSVLVPALVLATFHRGDLLRLVEQTALILRKTVRGEAALVLAVALGGSLLALLAPPVTRVNVPRLVDLAAKVPGAAPAEDLLVHFQVRPLQLGENDYTVLVTSPDGTPLPEPPVLVRLAFSSLNQDAASGSLPTQPDGASGFTARGLQLSPDGWWRVEVTIQRIGLADSVERFYVLLPDPNLDGPDAVRIPQLSPEAMAVYERGRSTFTSLHRWRSREQMSNGIGHVAVTDQAVSDGTDGRPPSRPVTVATSALIQIGEREWLRVRDKPWLERKSEPINPPSEWDQGWAGATGFRLGRVEDVGGGAVLDLNLLRA